MNCVKGEIHNVLSMMRVNARWASAERFRQEIPAATQSPMMRAFKQLHYELQSVVDLADVDTVTYLLPFIMVIESERTSGFITGAAISSLNKFLLYGLLTSDSLRADVAINRIAVCVARCRFEETHRDDDETVLIKLLELVEYCLRSDAGPLITGENVWKMMQLCYHISDQPRSSLHLCRAAENTLAHLILTVFDRINELEPAIQQHATTNPSTSQKATAHASPLGGDQELDEADALEALEAAEAAARGRPSPSTLASPTSVAATATAAAPTRSSGYGIPLLERILQFLASLISPAAKDDATCILGLRLINVVLETAGTGLGQHPGLVSVLQGDLSKYLLQNSETEELGILSLTLRVVFNLFNSIKDHLKVQLEVFFTSVHMRIIDSPSCSDEQKELALESLLEFCREPAMMLDLYINYDCDVHCTNLFEVLCKSLARNCQAMEGPNGTLNALTLLCLEGLLAVIEVIARRCPLGPASAGAAATNGNASGSGVMTLQGSDLARFTSGPSISPPPPLSAGEIPLEDISPMSSVRDLMQLVMSGSDSETDSDYGDDTGSGSGGRGTVDQLAWLHTARERTAEVLQQRKRMKKRYALAAEKFNTEPKKWISYAQEMELLPEQLTPESVASFLLHTPGLNKTLIGDYLGDGPPEKYPFNASVREAYLELLDFRDTRSLDEALRLFLSRFRLPGEAQKIDRMMEAFSKQFHLQCGEQGPLASADAAFILSFSIIMLNTDLHSDHIAKKMTLEEFVRNNRGINEGKDLPVEYLTALYENIRTKEIQMQHDVSDFLESSFSTVDRYSTQWDGVLKRSENVVGASFTSNSSILKLRAGLYEKEMFLLIADRTIQCLLLAYEKTCDVTNMERALEGLSNCAKIALYYDMSGLFNKIMASLSTYFLTFAHGVLNGEKVFMPSTTTSSTASNSENRPGATTGQNRSQRRTSSMDDSEESEHGPLAPEPDAMMPMPSRGEGGAKTRRALLSLKLLFQFVQKRHEAFRKAWTSVIECVLMFNELDVIPTSLVEMDDFVDSRGVPLPPIQGSSPSPTTSGGNVGNSSQQRSGGSASVPASTAATGSGKTRERSRRVAERQAAIRSRMKSMSSGSHTSYGNASNTNSGSIWGSLSSYLWSEDEKVDETFSLVNQMLKEAVGKLGGGLLEKDNWLRMVRKLDEAALTSLLETLLTCRDPFKGVMRPSDGVADAMMQENAILVLELSVDLILVNTHRILSLKLWESFHAYATKILSTPLQELQMHGLAERVVVHILRVSIRLFHDEKIRPKLMTTLQMLQTVDEEVYRALSDRIAIGINMLLKANLVYMHDFHDWNVLMGILENVVQYKNGRAACWESVKLLAEGGHLNAENVTLWIATCLRFVSHRTPYSVDALRLLQGLAASDSPYKMDGRAWLEVMRVMLSYLNDDRPPIAKTAWECLHNSLLLPGVPVEKDTWKQCFDEVIFAFDDQVNEGIWSHSREAALYSVTLLSKTFLHNLQELAELPNFDGLWLNVLHRLALKLQAAGPHAASSSHAAVVFETTLQSLYNLLLILQAEQILDRVCQQIGHDGEPIGEPETLWDATCRVVDEVIPNLKDQLGLMPPPPPEPTSEEPQPAGQPAEQDDTPLTATAPVSDNETLMDDTSTPAENSTREELAADPSEMADAQVLAAHFASTSDSTDDAEPPIASISTPTENAVEEERNAPPAFSTPSVPSSPPLPPASGLFAPVPAPSSVKAEEILYLDEITEAV